MHGFVALGQNIRRVFAPFDEHDAASVEIFVEADFEQRLAVEDKKVKTGNAARDFRWIFAWENEAGGKK